MLVYVEGKLDYKEFEDRSGTKHKRAEVTAATLRLLGSPSGEEPAEAPPPAAPGAGADALSSFVKGG